MHSTNTVTSKHPLFLFSNFYKTSHVRAFTFPRSAEPITIRKHPPTFFVSARYRNHPRRAISAFPVFVYPFCRSDARIISVRSSETSLAALLSHKLAHTIPVITGPCHDYVSRIQKRSASFPLSLRIFSEYT